MKSIQHFLLSILFFGSSQILMAQYEPAVFDYTNAYFNNGQALKAESNLMFSGPISRKIERVEVSLFRAKASEKHPLYTGVWKRNFGNMQENFNMPFNYKLKGDANYDWKIDFFREISKEEKEELKQSIYGAVDNYLDQNFMISGRKVKMLNSTDAVMSDINAILKSALTFYRNESEVTFPGFSDIIRRGMQSLMGRRLSNAESANMTDNNDVNQKQSARAELFQKRLADLKAVAHNEIDQVMNTHLLVRADSRKVVDYPTEHTKNELAVNVGYGAVYFSGDLKTLDYGRAPYAGLSFPLGNSALSGRFMSNSSISVGAFFNNFKDKNDNTITGPIVGRPFYVGYGYRMFRFLRLNAGAAFLQADASKNGITNLNVNTIAIRPYIGISAEIKLWMGLGDKR